MKIFYEYSLINSLNALALDIKGKLKNFSLSFPFNLETIVLLILVFQGVILVITPSGWKGELIFALALVIFVLLGSKWSYSFSNLGIVWGTVAGFGAWIFFQQLLDAHGAAAYGGKVAILWFASFSTLFGLSILLISVDNWKRLEMTLTVLEFFLVVQILISFFTGLGEFYSYRDGSVRALGFLSDSISPIVGFFVVKNAVAQRIFRTCLTAFALAIVGGKMALAVTLVAGILILTLGKRHAFAVFILLLANVTAYVGLELCFALELPKNKFYEYETIPPPSSWPLKDIKGSFWLDRLDNGSELNRYPINRLGQLTFQLVGSGSNRFLSFVFAAELIKQQPLIGVGFTRSNDNLSDVVNLDPFGMNKYFTNPQILWSKVRSIHNAGLRVTAELGFIGLVLFISFCSAVVLVFLKVLRYAKNITIDSNSMLAIAAASWGISFVMINQTVAWITPGHPQLLWLLIALGISARFPLPDRLSLHIPTPNGSIPVNRD